MSPLLLFYGFVRVGAWLTGAVAAVSARDWRWAPGLSLATFGSTVFAVSNAGGHVPEWAFDAATITSTPAAALIVSAYLRDRIDGIR